MGQSSRDHRNQPEKPWSIKKAKGEGNICKINRDFLLDQADAAYLHKLRGRPFEKSETNLNNAKAILRKCQRSKHSAVELISQNNQRRILQCSWSKDFKEFGFVLFETKSSGSNILEIIKNLKPVCYFVIAADGSIREYTEDTLVPPLPGEHILLEHDQRLIPLPEGTEERTKISHFIQTLLSEGSNLTLSEDPTPN